jgi:hypothetical protein
MIARCGCWVICSCARSRASWRKTVRANVTTRWTVRENVRANLRVLVKRLLRRYGYPPDEQEKATREAACAGGAVGKASGRHETCLHVILLAALSRPSLRQASSKEREGFIVEAIPVQKIPGADTLHRRGVESLIQYQTKGRLADLNRAVTCCQKALHLAPRDSPNRPAYLHTVATARSYARRTYRSRTRLRRCAVESTATTPVGRDVRSAREKDQPA